MVKELWWVVPNALFFFFLAQRPFCVIPRKTRKKMLAKESVGTRDQLKKTESERVQICCYVPVQGVSNTS